MKFVAVTLLAFAIGISMTVEADPVDEYVNATLAHEKIPGASVLIVRDGAIIKAQGYGFANIELGVPATADTVYESGSMGKQFTAAGILLLVEDGKLSLDDRLSMYFPDAPSAWHRISVRQLLTHTSGIHDYVNDPDIDLRKDYSEDDFLKIMMRLSIDFEPGTQWSYSNSGYVILGLLTSKLAGEHWSKFQAERLFKPLGMTNTGMISESAIVNNRAAGYELDAKGDLKNQEWVSQSMNETADGTLYFTIKDLAAWDKALSGGHLLSAASQEAWMRPVRLTSGTDYPYGFGWEINEQRGQPLIEHGGWWQGFRTAIARYVDQGLTVVVLTNLASANPVAMAHEVAGLVEPKLKLPVTPSTAKDPMPTRTAELRQVLASWAASRPDARMAKGLAETATGSVMEAYSRALTAARLKQQETFLFLNEDRLSLRPLHRRGEQVTSILYYLLTTRDKHYAYRFYLTKKGQVSDFDAEEL